MDRLKQHEGASYILPLSRLDYDNLPFAGLPIALPQRFYLAMPSSIWLLSKPQRIGAKSAA